MGSEQLDRDRLLPGEDPCTEFEEDAWHWIHVYRELTSIKRQMIESFRRLVAAQGSEARAELERDDLRSLKRQLDRYERRLRYWQERQSQLTSRPDGPSAS